MGDKLVGDKLEVGRLEADRVEVGRLEGDKLEEVDIGRAAENLEQVEGKLEVK